MSLENRTCPNCKTDTLEELGTAGFIVNDEYHNEHHWRCSNCLKRFDKTDCTCNKGSCKGNSEHHRKNTNKFKDGR